VCSSDLDDITYHYKGYLTKREPTALGFSRWIIKK
jgi:hypothetical protein